MDTPVDMLSENTAPDVQNGEEKDSNISDENQGSLDSKSKTSIKKPVKKSKEEKRNKEEEKRIKLLLRAFEGLDSQEAKVYAIAKKYVQLAADNKSLEYKKDELETRSEKLIKERDTLQCDYNKATLAKSKLESLCRELQRHSKLVKEECQLRAQEEEAKRKELSDRFQTTINDISQQMQDNFKRNEQLKKENEELATKLKGLVSQYETREEHVDKVVQHKQLELQLAEAKMAQQSLQFNEMKEKSLLEKQELLQDSLDYRKRYEIMVKQEQELKAQLAMYTERFDDFQSTLNKSNEVFATFKCEMDKMTKTIKKLEKENKTFKSRYENTNKSLLAMLDERSNMEKEIQNLKTKNSKLENLCRAMQKGVLVPKDNISEERAESTELDAKEAGNHTTPVAIKSVGEAGHDSHASGQDLEEPSNEIREPCNKVDSNHDNTPSIESSSGDADKENSSDEEDTSNKAEEAELDEKPVVTESKQDSPTTDCS